MSESGVLEGCQGTDVLREKEANGRTGNEGGQVDGCQTM